MVESGQPLTIFGASNSPCVTSFPAPIARQVAPRDTNGTSAQLLVSVCGRSISIDLTSADSVEGLQSALQTRLNMEGQLFQFFDADGAVLATNSQVQEAVKGSRVPLCATLTDASIHLIQNRREELAQMQWQLIRDQLTGNTGKMAALERRVYDIESQIGLEKTEARTLIERVKTEIERNLEESLLSVRNELRMAFQSTETTGQLIAIERNKSEVALEVATDTMHKHINSLRETVDVERSARKQDMNVYSSIIQEAKTQLDAEKIVHRRDIDSHAQALQTLNERIDVATNQFAEMVADHDRFFKKSAAEVSAEARQNSSQVSRMRMEAESSIAEVEARFRCLEQHCSQLDARLSETGTRQADSVHRLIERQEQTAQMMEGLRVEERAHQDVIQNFKESLGKLDDSFMINQDEMRDLIGKERRSREEHMRRLEQVILQRHSKQISDLEHKLTDRLEQKSSERETQVKQIFDEVIAKHSDTRSREKASEEHEQIGDAPSPSRWPSSQASILPGPTPVRALAGMASVPTPSVVCRQSEVSPLRMRPHERTLRHANSFSTTTLSQPMSMTASQYSSNFAQSPSGSYVSSCAMMSARQASPDSRARSASRACSTTASTAGSQMTSVVVPSWPGQCEVIQASSMPVSSANLGATASVTTLPEFTPQNFTFK